MSLSLKDKLYAKMIRRQTLASARMYARRVLQELPIDTSSEAYCEVAAAYEAIAREHNKS